MTPTADPQRAAILIWLISFNTNLPLGRRLEANSTHLGFKTLILRRLMTKQYW